MDILTLALVNSKMMKGIDTAVGDYLDKHPEKTTTVQDGAVTIKKFSDSVFASEQDVADLVSIIEGRGEV